MQLHSPTCSAVVPNVTKGSKNVVMQIWKLLKHPQRWLDHAPVACVKKEKKKVNIISIKTV